MLRVTDCDISGNWHWEYTDSGGGIYNAGELELIGSRISKNRAGTGGRTEQHRHGRRRQLRLLCVLTVPTAVCGSELRNPNRYQRVLVRKHGSRERRSRLYRRRCRSYPELHRHRQPGPIRGGNLDPIGRIGRDDPEYDYRRETRRRKRHRTSSSFTASSPVPTI